MPQRATAHRRAPPATRAGLPTWIQPQLSRLVKDAPDGSDWLHEIKLDGYRMHARLHAGMVQIRTRRGYDWTGKYPAIADAMPDCRRGTPISRRHVAARGRGQARLRNIADQRGRH